ncbi:MAG TPA: VCBS repeat-containing protein, partial [Bryobacteraceae bacterium]|nr:VCBS repeat-containing protein [Bryobacteraceae bacterium]
MLILFLLLALSAAGQEFRANTIATGLRGGYQVVPWDMNRDGKPDLIALASGMPELVWYENPTWQRHVIFGPLPRMINLAIHDIEGDGAPEIAVASLFENVAKDSVGVISILRLENGAWTAKEIDRVPTSHR